MFHVPLQHPQPAEETISCDQNSCKVLTPFYVTYFNRNYLIVSCNRLWNATLVEDFPGIHTVRIRSKAHINLDPSLEITQRTDDDFDYVTYFFQVNFENQAKNILFKGGNDGLSRPTRHWRIPGRSIMAHHRECFGRNTAASSTCSPALVVGLLQAKATRSHSQGQPLAQREGAQRVHLVKTCNVVIIRCIKAAGSHGVHSALNNTRRRKLFVIRVSIVL